MALKSIPPGDSKSLWDVVVLGSGGCEHAICWKLSDSKLVEHIYAIPGNGGTEDIPKTINISLDIYDSKLLIEKRFSQIKKPNVLVIAVPETLLARGIADDFYAAGILCFGPKKAAARLEWDKQWAKNFMNEHHIPTARWKCFTRSEIDEAKQFIRDENSYEALVVKASGLAKDNGVIVSETKDEACSAVDELFSSETLPPNAADIIIVEELLKGKEITVMAFTDGDFVKVMLPVQNYKRLRDSDQGPNTRGMGATCPFFLTDAEARYIKAKILLPTIRAIRNTNDTEFIGVLSAGLMITTTGIKVLGFNCTFCDPETQVLMPLLESDLFEVIEDCYFGFHESAESDEPRNPLIWKPNLFSVGVVAATQDYPNNLPQDPIPVSIQMIEELDGDDDLYPEMVKIFHSNTTISRNGENFNVFPGRPFTAVAVNQSLITAMARAYNTVEQIPLIDKQFRTDIGQNNVMRDILKRSKFTFPSTITYNTRGMSARNFTGQNVSPSVGSFGALIDPFDIQNYDYPMFVTSSEEIGIKLKIAQQCDIHSTIGQDLVALCANDILAHGARPLLFFDYLTYDKSYPATTRRNMLAQVVVGLVRGCANVGCSFIGREPTEMRGIYTSGPYNLTGFCVGAVERDNLLPRRLEKGDVVIYLPSSGVHSHGFNVIRTIMQDRGLSMASPAPFSSDGKTYAEEFLTPTKIYTNEVEPLVRHRRLIKAFIPISNGGLIGSVSRMMLENTRLVLNARLWHVPPVFGWIAAFGGVSANAMLQLFNCGVGALVITSGKYCESVCSRLSSVQIGVVFPRCENEPEVVIKNFEEVLIEKMNPFLQNITTDPIIYYKRVAVLISGTDPTLQALIDSTMEHALAPARIVCVISNKDHAGGLTVAQGYGIPTEVVHDIRVRNRTGTYMYLKANEWKINRMLKDYKIDVVCLVGFERKMGVTFLKKWRRKSLSSIPSLYPAFKEIKYNKPEKIHKAVLKMRQQYSACTIYYTEGLDKNGKIIEQALVRISNTDTVATLAEKIKLEELKLFPRGLKKAISEITQRRSQRAE